MTRVQTQASGASVRQVVRRYHVNASLVFKGLCEGWFPADGAMEKAA